MIAMTLDMLVTQYQAGRREFRLTQLSGHASDIDLSGIDLSGARLEKVVLDSVILHNANLSGTHITGMIRHVDFTGADFSGCEFSALAGQCKFEDASFRGAKLNGATFHGGRFRPATLQEVDLRGGKFHHLDLRGVDLSALDCSDTVFADCDLTEATLTSTKFFDAALGGSQFKRAHLQGAQFYKADLRTADLSESLCQGADFRRAELTGVQFVRAQLEGCDFDSAVMGKANMKGANLAGATLRDVDLTSAVIVNADFSRSDLSRATLEFSAGIGADFTAATLQGANFQRSLLRGAIFHSANTRGTFFWEAELDEGALTTDQLERASTSWKVLPDMDGRVLYSDDSDRRVTHTVVRVFFATDRSRLTYEDGAISYGDARNEDCDAPLEFGTCDVSVPRDHRMGKLEAPSILRLEINWNVKKHIVLRKVQRHDESAIYQAINEHARDTEGRQLLLFVHGFNVSFEDAARRCAQISYDLAFDGAPIFYSWPSKATLPGYPSDEASVEWTADHLCSFIQKLLDLPDVSALHILAHSMGNRAVMAALDRLGDVTRQGRRALAHVALTAPDVDAGVFTQLAPRIVPRARKITLYASDNDRALKASREVHDYRRAGQAGDLILVLPGMDTIDATPLDTDFLGHSYYGDNRSVISDIFYLIRNHDPKDRHGLHEALLNDLPYWKFQS